MPASSTTSKEKGNAAFKAGDYVAAIGHYTEAALADPSEPTFFLNRAAAYLKLSKDEDAERDCSTVLGLSNNKNVKALFRRAQARAALERLGDAHNDLQRALKLEPNNEAVKAELARVDGLIVNGKGKGKARSAPVKLSTATPALASSSSPAAPPKRRRVPITIVEDNDHPPIVTQPRGNGDDLLLNPVSSRRVVQPPSTPPPPPDGKSAPIKPAPAPAASKPTPASSFREAKQAREAKSVGRVGGGIFRMSGNNTVFKTCDVTAPAVADPPKDPTPATSAPAPSRARVVPAAPRTLFEFTRAWDSIPSSDTATRWALLNSIHPTSLPALFGVSLEPALLASFISVLAAAAHTDGDEVTSRDAVRTVMCSLSRVSRFRTVVQFLSRAERDAARAVWEGAVPGTGDGGAEDAEEVEEAARTWGFTEA